MDTWDIPSLDIQPHQPQVLRSDDGAARAIALLLPAGEELQEHEVHEHAYLVLVDGEVRAGRRAASPGRPAGHGRALGSPGAARGNGHQRCPPAAGAGPWPGEGHPNLRAGLDG